MSDARKLSLATGLYLYALAVFAVSWGIALASGGAASQEAFQLFADPADYTARLRAADATLRIVLLADLFFIIGFAAAIGMTAYAYADNNPPAAWASGLGILLVAALDLSENITMILSLDLAVSGAEVPAGRILTQLQISASKWLLAALVVVIFTFTLPYDSWLEKLLVWATRVLMPLGTGLFVTNAFGAQMFGLLIILSALGGGLAMLALTTGLRARAAA